MSRSAFFLGQQWIEIAEPLDEAAIARRTTVGNDDVIAARKGVPGRAGGGRSGIFGKTHSGGSLFTSSFRESGRQTRPAIQEIFRRGPARGGPLAYLAATSEPKRACPLVSPGRRACCFAISAICSGDGSPPTETHGLRQAREGRAGASTSSSSCPPCHDTFSKVC